LISRKCNFHVVFFNQDESLCVPPSVEPEHYSKYLLARAVVIRHLQKNLPEELKVDVQCFQAFTDPAFEKYLNETGIYFIMCHDGADASHSFNKENLKSRLVAVPGRALQATRTLSQASMSSDETEASSIDSVTSNSTRKTRKLRFRAMISWFIAKKYNIALINEMRFVDTKVGTRNS
jgi:ATP-dependent RNA helicase DDX60